MKQSRPERGTTRRRASPFRATRRALGDGVRVAVATQFVVGRSALAVARFATRRHHASPGTTAATGAGDARRDAGTGRDGPEGGSAIRSAPGDVAAADASATDAAFDAFLETCVPLGHPPHE